MDSVKRDQVGVSLRYFPLSLLSLWERESTELSRVRTDLKDLIDYGFGEARSGRYTSEISPIQSPLPLGEG
jgi:hypothetical protein